MQYSSARRAYGDNGILTASPSRLLTMLYDRLVLDLQRGELALDAGDREGAHRALTHAQDVLLELKSSLKVELWDGGPRLMALYDWFTRRLIAANIRGDARIVAEVRGMIEPLRDAWHQAALQVASAAPAAALAGA